MWLHYVYIDEKSVSNLTFISFLFLVKRKIANKLLFLVLGQHSLNTHSSQGFEYFWGLLYLSPSRIHKKVSSDGQKNAK